jgi:hypothetical protein
VAVFLNMSPCLCPAARELVREVDYTLKTLAKNLLGQERSEVPSTGETVLGTCAGFLSSMQQPAAVGALTHVVRLPCWTFEDTRRSVIILRRHAERLMQPRQQLVGWAACYKPAALYV